MITINITEKQAYMLLEASENIRQSDLDNFEEQGDYEAPMYTYDKDTDALWKGIIGQLRNGIDQEGANESKPENG